MVSHGTRQPSAQRLLASVRPPAPGSPAKRPTFDLVVRPLVPATPINRLRVALDQGRELVATLCASIGATRLPAAACRLRRALREPASACVRAISDIFAGDGITSLFGVDGDAAGGRRAIADAAKV
jgi:hypothetical protein